MNFQPLKYIYKTTDNPDAYTLLLLHGTGGDETDLIPLAQNFGDGYNILSLRGNVSEHGMPRFFKRLGMGIFDEEDLHFRTDEMIEFIKELSEKEKFNANKIIAIGYSNGANIAGSAIIKYPGIFSGAILYRPMPPFKTINENGSKSSTKVFLSSGQTDPTVSLAVITEYLEKLKSMVSEVEYHVIPAGHHLTQQDVTLSAQWLSENFH